MIDVLIPAIEDDLLMLKTVIKSVRINVKDGVNNIFIISPQNDNIKKFCKENGCIFTDELEYIGFSKDKFNFGWRNGWFYQQLLKLNGDILSTTDDFLVIDSDHILLKPHLFKDGDEYNFYMSTEYHVPYFITMGRLFKGEIMKTVNKSFISDKMILNKQILKEMKDKIEKHCNTNWIDAINTNCFINNICSFSEFETYGNYTNSLYTNKTNLINDGRLMCFEKRIENIPLEDLANEFKNNKSITKYRFAN